MQLLDKSSLFYGVGYCVLNPLFVVAGKIYCAQSRYL